MLERITDFLAHPDLIFGYELVCDPAKAFRRLNTVPLRYFYLFHFMNVQRRSK